MKPLHICKIIILMTASLLISCANQPPQRKFLKEEVNADIQSVILRLNTMVRNDINSRPSHNFDHDINSIELANQLIASKEFLYFNRKYGGQCQFSDMTFPSSNGNKAFYNIIHAAFTQSNDTAFINKSKEEVNSLYEKIQKQAYAEYHCDYQTVHLTEMTSLFIALYDAGKVLNSEAHAKISSKKEQMAQEALAAEQNKIKVCRESKFTYSDSVAVDKKTGIAWARCSVGQNWNGYTCAGQATSFMLADALAYASNAKGWRLPSARELGSIVDFECNIDENKKYLPAFNRFAFPNTPSAVYWTSNQFDTLKANAGPYSPVFPDGVPVLKMNGAVGLISQEGRFDQFSEKYRGKTALRLVRTAP